MGTPKQRRRGASELRLRCGALHAQVVVDRSWPFDRSVKNACRKTETRTGRVGIPAVSVQVVCLSAMEAQRTLVGGASHL